MQAQSIRVAGESDKALPRRVNLTEASIKGLTCPAGKDLAYIYDQKVPGLACLVSAAGGRSFYWVGRVTGERAPIRFKIGKWPQVTLETARVRAKGIGSDAAEGINPQRAKREATAKARLAQTVGQLWTAYRDEHLKTACSPATLRSDESRYKLHLSVWAGKAIPSITREDVAELHAALSRKKRHKRSTKVGNSADKAVKLLRRMLTWAKVSPNPAAGGAVKFVGDEQRERFLNREELGRLTKALDSAENQTIADAIRLALLTGARRGNVCSARWADLHLDQGLWVIPRDQSKNKRTMAVTLAPAAVELLTKRKAANEAAEKPSPFVFPGKVVGQPIIEVKSTWHKIREAAGVADCRMHDLRHTLASHMAMAGVPLLHIGKQLGHASKQSTSRYTHLEVSVTRDATAAGLASMFKPAKA